jgi:hypothetical protein
MGLSTDHVMITAGFSGEPTSRSSGRIDNADPLVSRQGRYDVIVVLEGPARPVVVRAQGTRVLGVWINHRFLYLPQRPGVLLRRDDARVSGRHRPEHLQATVARRGQHLSEQLLRRKLPERSDDRASLPQRCASCKQATGLYSAAGWRRAVPVAEPLPRHSAGLARRARRHASRRAPSCSATASLHSAKTSAQLSPSFKSGFEQWVFRTSRRPRPASTAVGAVSRSRC